MKRKTLQFILGVLVTTTLVLSALIGGTIYIANNKNAEVAVTEQDVAQQGEKPSPIAKSESNTVIEDKHTTAELVPEETTTEPDTSIHVQGNGTGDTYTATTEEEIAYMKYVDSQILDPTTDRSTAPMFVVADTNVYSEMSLESEILGQVVFNQELAVYGNVDGWFVIQYGDRDGFIPQEFLDSVKQQVVVENTEKPEVIQSSTATPETTTPSTPSETVTQPSVTPTPEVSPDIVDKDTNAGVPIPDNDDSIVTDAEIKAFLESVGLTGQVSGNGTVINPNSKPADVDGILDEEQKEHTKDWIVH